jgi:uncharacterized protein (TIGR01777 family)
MVAGDDRDSGRKAAMRVVVTGATGNLGREVVAALQRRGDQVVALSRDPRRATERLGTEVEAHAWPAPVDAPPPVAALQGADAVVHLLGEPVAQRWSAEAKHRIRDSRVLGTRWLVEGLLALPDDQRPRTLISQSATGFYGPSDDRRLDEAAPSGSDFLAGVVAAWEHEALLAEAKMRVVRTRTGVVLSREGGALAQMLPFFRLGLGGPVAGGRQYVPWVHLDDVVASMICCLDATGASGAVNVTAPEPVTNADFSRALGRALGRPAVLPVPGFALRLLYGEMAQIVTTGQRVVPAALANLGYEFHYPEIDAALRDVLKRS